jgi:hypothetical protein
LDIEEVQTIEQFLNDTCGCSKKPGSGKQGLPCSNYFNEAQLAEVRMSMAELSKDELDLVILGQINAHHFSGQRAGHRTANEISQGVGRVKDYTTFFYKSFSVCLKTFLFVHNVGK